MRLEGLRRVPIIVAWLSQLLIGSRSLLWLSRRRSSSELKPQSRQNFKARFPLSSTLRRLSTKLSVEHGIFASACTPPFLVTTTNSQATPSTIMTSEAAPTNTMNTESLHVVLQQSFSPDASLRDPAERTIRNLKNIPGASVMLLQVAAEKQVRRALFLVQG